MSQKKTDMFFLASNQEGSTASVLNAMSDVELELGSGAGHPFIGNPDMTDPQIALRLQELSQGLGAATQGAGSIKSLKDTADGPEAAIERLIPVGVNATRCLRVTYAMGNGSHHFAARVGNVSS